MTTVELMEGGYCIAGLNFSLASLLVEMGYSETLGVDRLIPLAACMLLVAGRIDPLCIAGEDIAVYRDSVGKFEFVQNSELKEAAAKLDSDIRKIIAG